MDIRFDDKVLLVISASSGIGEATEKIFAESGATIFFATCREEFLKKIMFQLMRWKSVLRLNCK
ncbi:hypothetical protein [Lentilactobacillus hilgardii]|uniref:hypothetical protein n=1 Tax=Lentilactobacillus hilgardii TaxID=1588 RepID=UPI0039EA1962